MSGSAGLLAVGDTRIAAPESVVPANTRRRLLEGAYERDELQCAGEVLDATLPLVDLGAGIGVVSCSLNGRLHDPEQHLAVEMNPHAFSLLERNRGLNGCEFTSLHARVAYPSSRAGEAGHGASAAARNGYWDPTDSVLPPEVEAPAVITLSEMLAQRGWDEFNLVVDIQGGEVELFAEERDAAFRSARSIVVDLHPHIYGAAMAARLVDRARQTGLHLRAVAGSAVALRRD